MKFAEIEMAGVKVNVERMRQIVVGHFGVVFLVEYRPSLTQTVDRSEGLLIAFVNDFTRNSVGILASDGGPQNVRKAIIIFALFANFSGGTQFIYFFCSCVTAGKKPPLVTNKIFTQLGHRAGVFKDK